MSDIRPHVVFISYNGLVEPLGASQVLPYLDGLSSAYRFTVISFERDGGPEVRTPDEVEEELRSAGGRWVRLRYHRRLGLPSKILDLALGSRALSKILATDPVALVHARGYVPAQIAALACGSKVPFLFDIRGLQAEESVDAGTWKAGGLKYRLTKHAERRLLRNAAGIVTLTDAIRPWLAAQPGLAGRDPPWETIPCCVDLDLFRFDEDARARIRKEIDAGDAIVFVYSGSIGTWYQTGASVDLVARSNRSRPSLLLFLSYGDEREIREHARRSGLPEDRLVVRRASRREMPGYLSAADIALCLVAPTPSKRASSPTKVAEALACGLPVISRRGVGDLDRLDGDAIWFADPADPQLPPFGLLDHDRGARLRRIAEAEFSLGVGVTRYRRLYERLVPQKP